MGRILFIINPVSGKGDGKRLAATILKKVTHSDNTAIVFTRYKSEAGEIVREKLNEGFDTFVAVGGDGTVNEVAAALLHTGGKLGIIPNGSGNGLARHLKIPMQVAGALEVVLGAKVKQIDYGLLNDRPFFCVSGVGFDAHVGHVFSVSHNRGFISYVRASLREFFRYKPQKYSMVIDGVKRIKRRAFLVTFANGSQYGNNAYIAPAADVSDGLMDVCILRPFHFIKSFGFIYALFGRKLAGNSMMEIIRCRQVRLKRKKPGYIHIDGEPGIVGKKLTVTLVSKGLRVIIP